MHRLCPGQFWEHHSHSPRATWSCAAPRACPKPLGPTVHMASYSSINGNLNVRQGIIVFFFFTPGLSKNKRTMRKSPERKPMLPVVPILTWLSILRGPPGWGPQSTSCFLPGFTSSGKRVLSMQKWAEAASYVCSDLPSFSPWGPLMALIRNINLLIRSSPHECSWGEDLKNSQNIEISIVISSLGAWLKKKNSQTKKHKTKITWPNEEWGDICYLGDKTLLIMS